MTQGLLVTCDFNLKTFLITCAVAFFETLPLFIFSTPSTFPSPLYLPQKLSPRNLNIETIWSPHAKTRRLLRSTLSKMVSGKLAEIKANQDRLLEELQGLRDELDKPTKLPSCEEIRPNNPLDNNQKRAFAAKWEVGGNMNLVEFVQDMARQKLADIENKVAKSDDGKAAWQDICGSSTEEEVRKRDVSSRPVVVCRTRD